MPADTARSAHLAGLLLVALGVVGGYAWWMPGATAAPGTGALAGAAVAGAALVAAVLALPGERRVGLVVRVLVVGPLALAEEILFRALPLELAAGPGERLAAAAIATMLFVLLHGRRDPRELVRLTGLALTLVVAYLAGGLTAAFLLHLGHNLIVLAEDRRLPAAEVAGV